MGKQVTSLAFSDLNPRLFLSFCIILQTAINSGPGSRSGSVKPSATWRLGVREAIQSQVVMLEIITHELGIAGSL